MICATTMLRPRTLGAVTFAGDEAVRSRMDQGRQDQGCRPFPTHAAPIVAPQKRSGAVHRHAKRRHPPARKNTIPIIPRKSRRAFVQSGFNEVPGTHRTHEPIERPAGDLTEASRLDLTEASRFPNRYFFDSPWQTGFEGFAMSTPVPLRSDFDAISLRKLARRSHDPDQTRRLLALAEIYDGGSRLDAARIGGVGLQIVRDWVVRFNAKGADGLLNGKAPGAPSILDNHQRQALRQIVEGRPHPGHPWRRTLAADRSGPMDLRGVSGLDLQADAQPRAAAHGLSQALGTTAPSRARRGSRKGI